MEKIVGYLFGVLYYKRMLCVLIRIASSRHSNECNQDTFARKISLNYPYIVFGGNPCRLKNVFDSSMVNEPLGFEPLKFYCNLYSLKTPVLVAQLDAPSDWRPEGHGFNPHQGRQYSFMEIDHEIFSTVILSLPLIQEEQLSVSVQRMCTIPLKRTKPAQ